MLQKNSFYAGLALSIFLSSFVNTTTVSAQTTKSFSSTNDYIENPGMGWQYMRSSNESHLPETVAYPDRVEISWRILQTGPNTYNWKILDDKISAAKAEGKQISFRVYTMRGEVFGGHQLPQFVIDAGATLLNGEVNYSNCVYQDEWSKFVNVLKNRYDGNQDIAYLDISGYGNFNEWSWHNQTQFDDNALNPSTNDGLARRRLVEMFIGGSNSSHKCTNSQGQTQTTSYSYPGFNKTQLIMPYAGIRQSSMYVASKRSDVGFRFDCLGRDALSSHPSDIQNLLKDKWKQAPVVYELCAVDWNSSAFIQRTNDLLKHSHGILVHDNPNDTPEPQQVIENVMRFVGYRYELKSATFNETVSQTQATPVSVSFANVGYAPSYPSMGQDFELRLLLTKQDSQVVQTYPLQASISSWLPAHPLPGTPPVNTVSEQVTLPSNLAAGTYQWKVAIWDKRTNSAITIANQGRNADGTVTLGSFNYTISGTQSSPNPSPSPSPTSTVAPSASPSPTATTAPQVCSEDLNQDNAVNLLDYSILVSHFFQTNPSNQRADINKDGVVNLLDYSLLVSKFFKSC